MVANLPWTVTLAIAVDIPHGAARSSKKATQGAAPRAPRVLHTAAAFGARSRTRYAVGVCPARATRGSACGLCEPLRRRRTMDRAGIYHTAIAKGSHHKGPRQAGNKSLISFRAGHGVAAVSPRAARAPARVPAIALSAAGQRLRSPWLLDESRPAAVSSQLCAMRRPEPAVAERGQVCSGVALEGSSAQDSQSRTDATTKTDPSANRVRAPTRVA